jgi:hypothetical protein
MARLLTPIGVLEFALTVLAIAGVWASGGV